MGGGELVAGVVRLNDIGRCAILTARAEAKSVSDLQVRARRVDLRVHDRELVAVPSCMLATQRGKEGGTYVEALLAAEMESQTSPS